MTDEHTPAPPVVGDQLPTETETTAPPVSDATPPANAAPDKRVATETTVVSDAPLPADADPQAEPDKRREIPVWFTFAVSAAAVFVVARQIEAERDAREIVRRLEEEGPPRCCPPRASAPPAPVATEWGVKTRPERINFDFCYRLAWQTVPTEQRRVVPSGSSRSQYIRIGTCIPRSGASLSTSAAWRSKNCNLCGRSDGRAESAAHNASKRGSRPPESATRRAGWTPPFPSFWGAVGPTAQVEKLRWIAAPKNFDERQDRKERVLAGEHPTDLLRRPAPRRRGAPARNGKGAVGSANGPAQADKFTLTEEDLLGIEAKLREMGQDIRLPRGEPEATAETTVEGTVPTKRRKRKARARKARSLPC